MSSHRFVSDASRSRIDFLEAIHPCIEYDKVARAGFHVDLSDGVRPGCSERIEKRGDPEFPRYARAQRRERMT